MTPEQRREYIAEKILGFKKIRETRWELPRWKFMWNGPFVTTLPDFESLPEWTGPICEVVLPMLEELDLCIVPIGRGIGICDVEKSSDYDNCWLWLPNKNLSTALVDAHIKITGEGGE